MKRLQSVFFLVAALLVVCAANAQNDWIRTGTGLGQEKVRLGVADFKASGADPRNGALLKTFNDTLWNDLDNAGIFDMASKSFYPLAQPAMPGEVKLDAWANPPANVAMLAFGNLGVVGSDLAVQGWLDDVKNAQSPIVLGKEYKETATDENARLIAHKFANEIIFRLGGGVNGIAESKLAAVRPKHSVLEGIVPLPQKRRGRPTEKPRAEKARVEASSGSAGMLSSRVRSASG